MGVCLDLPVSCCVTMLLACEANMGFLFGSTSVLLCCCAMLLACKANMGVCLDPPV